MLFNFFLNVQRKWKLYLLEIYLLYNSPHLWDTAPTLGACSYGHNSAQPSRKRGKTSLSSLTSSLADLGRCWEGLQCKQSVAASSSQPAPHPWEFSARTPWLTKAPPTHSQCSGWKPKQSQKTLPQTVSNHKLQSIQGRTWTTWQVLPGDAGIPQVREACRGSSPTRLLAASGPAQSASVLAAASSAWSLTGCFHSDLACLQQKEKLLDLRERSYP